MEGHIKQKPNGRWFAQVYIGRDANGKPKYRKQTFRTKPLAERWRNKALAEIESGEYVDTTRMKVGKYLEYWLENYARSNVSAKTLERYEEIIRKHLIPALGNIQLSKLKPMQIQAHYTDALANGRRDGKGGLSARTVLQHHRILRKALHDAVRWQLIVRNPCDSTEPPKAQYHEPTTYDKVDIARILERLKNGSKYYLPVAIAVYTGMRRGEILGLRWTDIDLDAGYLIVNRSLGQTHKGIDLTETKTTSSRRKVYLTPNLITILAEEKHRRQMDNNLYEFVCVEHDGNLMQPDAFSQTYRSILRNMNLTGKRLHDFRHTQATVMLLAGEHPKVVQERLGHSSITTTMNIYSHVMPSIHEKAAHKLDELLG